MTDQPACPRCGTPLPVEAHGLCPTCALRTAATPAGGAPQRAMPTIQELAPAFPNYQFVEPIGRGAMGAVYLARHHKLDRQVAIKIMLAPDGTDPTFAERFAREARALARLDHPGIVGVHDFGEAAGHCFLVMDYVDGANLRQMLAQGKLSRGDVLEIVPQLCDALQYAHERGVVHRDIKPENILVDQDGRVRIADFGLAKIAGDDPLRPSLTQSGGAVGTPHYMSPEQLRGAPVDHRADLYALGVVLYEMLTGELPVGRFAPPSKKGIADARLDEVVQKALDAEPQARYQHAREVKDDLGHQRPAGLPPRLPSDAAPRRLDPLDPGLLMPLVACLIATGLTYFETPLGKHNLWSTQVSAGVLPRVPVAALVFLLAVESLLQWLRWYGRPVPRVWSFGLLGVVIFYLLSIAATPAQPPADYGAGFLYLLALAVLLAGRFLKRWIEYGR